MSRTPRERSFSRENLAFRALLRSGGAVLALRAVGMAFAVLLTVVLSRNLGPGAFGTYGFAVVLLAISGIPIVNGWAILLLRTTAAGTQDQCWGAIRGLMRRGVQFAALTAAGMLCIGLAAWALLPVDGAPVDASIVAILAAVFFCDQIAALRVAMLRGLGNPAWGQIPDMLVRPALIVAAFLAIAEFAPPADLGDAFWALLAGASAAAVLGIAVLSRRTPKVLAQATPIYETRRWLAKSSVLASSSGLLVLSMQVDILMLGLLGSFEQVGVYRVAMQVALVSGFVYTALNLLAMDRFGALFAAGDAEQIRKTAALLSRIALLGALPLPVLFLFFGHEILVMTFGSGFADAIGPLFWLLGLQIVTAAAGMGNALLVMSNRETYVLRRTAIAVTANVGLCLVLIPEFGAGGAAFSSLMSLGGLRIALWLAAYRRVGVDTSVMGLRRSS